MKIITLKLLLVTSSFFAQSQQIGINTTNPDPSAIMHIENFSGIPATATATISGGAVNSVTITNPGKGYTSPPTINFFGGGAVLNGGSKAQATATISNGSITGVTITNGGSGYTGNPTVTISGGNKGMLLPNLNISNLTSTGSPVSSPADGLLAYNGASNTNSKALYFFNSTLNKWQNTLNAEDTPKIAYADLSGNLSVLDNAVSGVASLLLVNPLSISGVSNINGFKIVQSTISGQNYYSLILPQGNYLVEVNLNLSAPQENPPGQGGTTPLGSSAYYLMGYFIDFFNDTYDNSTGTFTHAANASRKEIPLISKVNTNHLATWSYYYSVPPNANSNTIGGLRLYLGRMMGGTFYDLVNVISNESYIKISKL